MFAVLGGLVFLILKPFISTILSSFILAYVFYPFYKKLKKWVRNESLAAFLVAIVVTLLLIVPLVFVTNSLSREARISYVFIKQKLATGIFPQEECTKSDWVCSILHFAEEQLEDPMVKSQVGSLSYKVTDFLATRAGQFIISVPGLLLNFFIMLFILYYLLKMGNNVIIRIERLLPLKKTHRKSLFGQLKDVTYGVIYGHIMVALIQAGMGVMAFWIFGVSAPILWGIVMFFLALLPFLGTPVVWVPAVIYKLFTNHPVQAAGLLVSGMIISTIDNFIKPKIVSAKAQVHPVLVLLGVIGGLTLFGIVGIIIGPVILSVFMTFLDIYEEGELEAKG